MTEGNGPPLVRSERTGPTLVLTIDHPPVNVLSKAVLEAISARLAGAEATPRRAWS